MLAYCVDKWKNVSYLPISLLPQGGAWLHIPVERGGGSP